VSSAGTLRIGDFGLSRVLSDATLWVTSNRQAGGSTRWMSPELLDSSQHTVTAQSDIWAYGMVGLVSIPNYVKLPYTDWTGSILHAIGNIHK
jgi:serine/threonine protein kinase